MLASLGGVFYDGRVDEQTDNGDGFDRSASDDEVAESVVDDDQLSEIERDISAVGRAIEEIQRIDASDLDAHAKADLIHALRSELAEPAANA